MERVNYRHYRCYATATWRCRNALLSSYYFLSSLGFVTIASRWNCQYYAFSSCVGKDCGTYTPGTGVSCSGISNRYPSQKSCTCISGYERSGNDNSYSVTCQANARWSSPDDSRSNYCYSECYCIILSCYTTTSTFHNISQYYQWVLSRILCFKGPGGFQL